MCVHISHMVRESKYQYCKMLAMPESRLVSANYVSWPVFVNKVLLGYNHTHCFVYTADSALPQHS